MSKQQAIRKHAIVFTQPSMTQQHQKDEVDVNNIMRRYVKTGVIDHVNRNQPFYGDVPAHTYHEAIEQVRKADEMFLELPSAVRKFFDNDPAQFLAFVQDPANKEDLYTMGLADRPLPSTLVQPSGQDEPGEAPAPASTDSPRSAADEGVQTAESN